MLRRCTASFGSFHCILSVDRKVVPLQAHEPFVNVVLHDLVAGFVVESCAEGAFHIREFGDDHGRIESTDREWILRIATMDIQNVLIAFDLLARPHDRSIVRAIGQCLRAVSSCAICTRRRDLFVDGFLLSLVMPLLFAQYVSSRARGGPYDDGSGDGGGYWHSRTPFACWFFVPNGRRCLAWIWAGGRAFVGRNNVRINFFGHCYFGFRIYWVLAMWGMLSFFDAKSHQPRVSVPFKVSVGTAVVSEVLKVESNRFDGYAAVKL